MTFAKKVARKIVLHGIGHDLASCQIALMFPQQQIKK
jgi:hypothetical protein